MHHFAVDYSTIPGLSLEVIETLYRVRPFTIVSPIGLCWLCEGVFCCISVDVCEEDVAEAAHRVR